MNKIAFLFPGQGVQYSGMGKDYMINMRKLEIYLIKLINH